MLLIDQCASFGDIFVMYIASDNHYASALFVHDGTCCIIVLNGSSGNCGNPCVAVDGEGS